MAGGLSSIRLALGESFPKANSYPLILTEFYKRQIQSSNLIKVYSSYNKGKDCFIKPKEDFKTFTGFILSEGTYDLGKLIRKYGKEYPVFTSSKIDIKSEYRVYVSKGSVLDTSFYFGEGAYLDYFIVNKVIDKLNKEIDIPNSYAIDFAILEDNSTVVLELNEGFSIDSYISSSESYFKVIKNRWDELTLD